MTKVFIVAAERSGDDLGAGLIKVLRQQDKTLLIEGIGGGAMRHMGVTSQMDIQGLSILGFVEGLKHYPMILRKVRECCDCIIQSRSEAVVLIDSWGFMIRVAKRLQKLGYKGQIIKYVAPQVWAMRAGRSKILARHVDLLLSIQPMDAPFFEPHGLDTIYVGNPIFDTDYRSGDADKIRKCVGNDRDAVLSIWFGSRPSEISQLAGDFIKVVKQLKEQNPNLSVVSAVAQSVRADVETALDKASVHNDITLFDEVSKKDVMAASTAALACSGTVTTQLASAGVPTIVAYRLNGLTFWAAKKLFKPSYISIVNIAAEAPLMPEFIQDAATPVNLAKALNEYLGNLESRENASKALLEQTDKMGAGTGQYANEKAASAILTALNF